MTPDANTTGAVRRSAMFTAGMGVAFAVLALLAIWLHQRLPGPDASIDEVVAFYEAGDSRIPVLLGLYILPFAGIAFIWFMVLLRMWITGTMRRENVLLSNIQLVAGILYLALFFGAAASNSVMAASVEFSKGEVDPDVAVLFPEYASTLLFVFGIKMAAMFVITTTSIGRGAKIFPAWLVWFGYLVGAVMLLSATFHPVFKLVFPIWMLVLSVFLLYRARRIPTDATLPERGEGLR
jgi:hypothetical protein